MKVKIKGKLEKEMNLKKGSSASSFLEKLKISENDVLIVKKGKLIISGAQLEEGDVVELLDVISGG